MKDVIDVGDEARYLKACLLALCMGRNDMHPPSKLNRTIIESPKKRWVNEKWKFKRVPSSCF
jgi:hypothetical protein